MGLNKVYRSDKILSMTLNMNGVPRRINFRPVMNYLPGIKGSMYETRDEEIQRALEARGGFGTDFYLDLDDSDQAPVEAAAPVEKVATEKPKEVVKVSSMADAKSWLVDNKGWEPKSRITKRGLIEAAEEYGIALEIGE